MKITFSVPAYLTRHCSDPRSWNYVPLPIPGALNGMKLTADFLEPYLDEELLIAGVVGGEIRGAVNRSVLDRVFLLWRGLEVHVVFWSPGSLSPSLMDKLHKEAAGQISDGIGSQGFDIALRGKQRTVNFNHNAEVKLHSVVDDGRVIPPPSPIAVAVRQGDTGALRKAIDAFPDRINSRLGGYTPLHTAILHGMVEGAELLIAAGADVNVLDPHDASTLQLCTFTRYLNDAQSTHIARLLLAKGVRKDHSSELTPTALEGALCREKPKLAALLRAD
jgi:hypothetical protein